MDQNAPTAFLAHFSVISDPRIERHRRYTLPEILLLSIAAVCCGCEGPTEIAEFGRDRLAWLRKYLPYENGVPSHDTIRRVLSMLKPEALESAFLSWISEFFPESVAASTAITRQIAIDGKSLRGTARPSLGDRALHLLSAWSTTHEFVLAQKAVDQKSNEITAIPLLLQCLELRGALVSIDAMGCQSQIAEAIIEGKGAYLLHVKENQPQLHAMILEAFTRYFESDEPTSRKAEHQTQESGHGRLEERCCTLLTLPPEMQHMTEKWSGLKSIAQITSVVEHNGKERVQTRFYITSLPATDVRRVAEAIRTHWHIENRLHWELDVSFGEDAIRIHDRVLAENLAMFRRFALSLIKQEPSPGSNKGKIKRANRTTDFLQSVLFGPVFMR